MKVIKVLVALLANVFTSYWMVKGIVNPEIIGYVKEYSGKTIQPDTSLLQISGFIILLFFHFIILYYIYSKLK